MSKRTIEKRIERLQRTLEQHTSQEEGLTAGTHTEDLRARLGEFSDERNQRVDELESELANQSGFCVDVELTELGRVYTDVIAGH